MLIVATIKNKKLLSSVNNFTNEFNSKYPISSLVEIKNYIVDIENYQLIEVKNLPQQK